MKSDFKKRRKILMEKIRNDSVLIIPSAQHQKRTRDVDYPYRQDSDFYYLTGFGESDSLMMLIPDRKNGQFILFCKDKDPLKERWDGPIAGPIEVKKNFDADQAYGIDKIDELLPKLIKGKKLIYASHDNDENFFQRLKKWIHSSDRLLKTKNSKTKILNPSNVIHEIRLIKSESEIRKIKKAAKIAVNAHRKTMSKVTTFRYEYELEAEIKYEFAKSNSTSSYIPIVGSGKNSCILHYNSNNSVLNDGDLVLIDAGCETEFYASDITRTYPINGRFTREQKEIYSIVLDAQKAAINQVKRGNKFSDPHDAAVIKITKGLTKIGLLKGNISDLIEKKKYTRFFMHRTSHWIGMDVHDVGDYMIDNEWRSLENGMILTIEPGIYIDDSEDIPEEYRKIGVRIEDMVLVNNDSPEVITYELEKEANEIEEIINNELN
mgnify:CR=1 FL=1